jgi:hypothetical protein
MAAQDTDALCGNVLNSVRERQMFEAWRSNADDGIGCMQAICKSAVAGVRRDQHYRNTIPAALPRERNFGGPRRDDVGFESKDAGFEVPEYVGNGNA